jgi:hypothetical protein
MQSRDEETTTMLVTPEHMNTDGTQVQNKAVPFLQNGRRLAPPVTSGHPS